MTSDQRFPTTFTRRRFLQYTGSIAAGSSLLAACAGGSSATAPTNPSLPSLTQWYHQYGESGTHEAVLSYAKQYEALKKANVTVNWVAGTGDAYPNAVRTALLGSTAPDVFELPSIGVDQVQAGQLEPLDDLIADVKDDFKPASLAPFTVNGKVYGIKMINDPTFVYYRKSMFTAAGIEIPKTMDDLIAAARKLTSGNVKGIYLGSDGGVAALYQIAGWSSGGELINTDNTKVTFNTERMANAYLKLHDLNKSGGVLPDAPTYWWDSSTFQQGLVAMQWCGLWAMPLIQKSAVKDDFGIFPWPASDAQGTYATVNGGWAQMVSAKSKNVQAAKDYVKWLWVTNAKIQTDWSVAYGFHVPPRISTSASADKLKTGSAADAVKFLGDYGHSLSPYWDNAIDKLLQDAVSTIVKSGGTTASVVTLLNGVADKCNTELQKLHG